MCQSATKLIRDSRSRFAQIERLMSSKLSEAGSVEESIGNASKELTKRRDEIANLTQQLEKKEKLRTSSKRKRLPCSPKSILGSANLPIQRLARPLKSWQQFARKFAKLCLFSKTEILPVSLRDWQLC
jgi:septal ring factor EnvC (AmiA/AmiB activator)